MIYTGYYSKMKEYADLGLTLLSISRTKPEFAKSCIDIPQLFPSDKILWDHKKGKIDEMEYTSKYLETMLFFYAGNLQKNFVIDIYWQIISTRTVVSLLRNLEKKMKYHSFKYG